MTAKRYDVAVIGGGHNGLTAAFYLARAGLSVVVLERRDLLGGCAVTEEIDPVKAPGCRVSTASYMASMLRPEVIRDLALDRHGLRMVAAEPTVQAVTPDGVVLPWWSDQARMRELLTRFAPADCERFLAMEGRLAGLARHLEPLFMQAPPDMQREGLAGLGDLLGFALKFRGLSNREIPELVAFATGSLGEFLDRTLESPHLKSLILANSLYGKHGGPYDPGTLFGLLFHLLGGGAESKQGFVGHVMGGMGAITSAMAEACRGAGVELRTGADVAEVRVAGGRATGVTLADGSTVDAGIVVSNADPKRTYLRLVPEAALDPEFRARVAGIKMDGPCGKFNLVLSEEPRLANEEPGSDALRRAQFTLVPWLDGAQAAYGEARRGRIAEELWIDCLVPSLIDDSLAKPWPARDDLLHPVPARMRSPDPTGASSASASRRSWFARLRASCPQSAARWSRSGSTRRPTSRPPSASPRATSFTATSGPTSCSSCGRCRASRVTPRRCRLSTCAARERTRAAASRARPGTTRRTGSWPTSSVTARFAADWPS